MRLSEEHQKKVATLRQALIEGELCGELPSKPPNSRSMAEAEIRRQPLNLLGTD